MIRQQIKLQIYVCTWLLFLMVATFSIQGQEINGIVIDSAQKPIPDVAVLSQNKTLAKTDADGKFNMTGVQLPFNARLVHPGYQVQYVQIIKNEQRFVLMANNQITTLSPVSLTNQSDSLSTSYLYTTIGSKEKARYSPKDLVPAINEIPGVYIQRGALNTNRITIRGVGSRTLFGSNKIRAYYNDIPITNGVGETSIDIYDSDFINTLRIIKGPKATAYGTSLGGTLLLKTRASDNYNQNSQVSTTATLGSFGFYKQGLDVSINKNDWQLGIQYGHLQQNGFRANSGYNRNNILIDGSLSFNPKVRLDLLYNHIDYKAFIASSLGATAFRENPSQAAFTWGAAKGFENAMQTTVGISGNIDFTKNLKNTTSIFYSNRDNFEPRPFNILQEYTHSYGVRSAITRYLTILENKAEISLGGEWYQDQYDWQTFENLYEENEGMGSLKGLQLSDNKEQRTQLNMYAAANLPVGSRWNIELGLNVNKTEYDYKDLISQGVNNRSGERKFNPIVAPNITINYTFPKDQSLYLNMSKGFNFPSLEETLTPNGRINPEIGPETGQNYEIGAQFLFFKKRLKMNPSLYFISISDLLVAERIEEDQFIGRNAGKTHHRGLEMSLDYTIKTFRNWHMRTFLNSAINFHRFIDFVDGNDDFSGNDLTGVPNRKINAGFTISYFNFQLTPTLLHVGSQPINDANTLYSDTYDLFYINAQYSRQINRLKCTAQVGIQNLFNAKYASSILINASSFGNNEPRYFYPGNPREYYGSLKVQYLIN